MSAPLITCSHRVRRTPFSRRVEAAGVKAYTVYNHMLLPTFFRSVEEDYAHLKSAVQVWDVACERQVELAGPDAKLLVQLSTPRDVSRMQDDQCYYIPNVDASGALLNDPILIKLAEDRFWVSISDSDMLLYYQGLASGLGLDVTVSEPDVSPLAIQGPYADELVRRVFGEDVVQTRFFRHRTVEIAGRSMVIARSGWSLQGGFELYLDGSDVGEQVWDILFEAGEDLDVRAGCPNGIERIEGGLLSYGSDMTRAHTPFEAGLDRFCNLEQATDCLGHAALLGKQNPVRRVKPIEIEGNSLPGLTQWWPLSTRAGGAAGFVSSVAWSPDFARNVAIATVDYGAIDGEDDLVAETPAGKRDVRIRDGWWIRGVHGPRAPESASPGNGED